jgi:hypothetical protein
MADEPKLEIGKDLLTYDQISRYIAQSSIENEDWSGMPVPVIGLKLVIEPRYKHKGLSDFQWDQYYDQDGLRHVVEKERRPKPSEFRTINSWWNAAYQTDIAVLQDKQGRAQLGLRLESRLSFTLRTLQAAAVWPVEAEQKSQRRLATLIPADMFDLYLLTGHFAETSKRSHLTYLFRRGRPTIVYREIEEESIYPLCALCLHPIGYYADSWAGVMCPTDEVIAHLLMMRGSEEKFWANANQHPLDHPAAGL